MAREDPTGTQFAAKCDRRGCPGCRVPARIAREPDESFDLIVVDGLDEGLPVEQGRVGCARAAAGKVRAGGLLMLDNSDRPAYREVDDLLEGWEIRRFVGFPASPFTPTETTFYRRPL